MPVGPRWSPFSYVNWELIWWDNHLSVTLQGGLIPLAKLVQTGFKLFQHYRAQSLPIADHLDNINVNSYVIAQNQYDLLVLFAVYDDQWIQNLGHIHMAIPKRTLTDHESLLVVCLRWTKLAPLSVYGTQQVEALCHTQMVWINGLAYLKGSLHWPDSLSAWGKGKKLIDKRGYWLRSTDILLK